MCLGARSAAHLGAGPSFASVRFGGQRSCPRRGRRRGSASPIDARRGLTGILLRSFGSSASLAVRCSSLLPTRELRSSLYFRAGRSLPHTQAAAAPLPPDSPQATSQPASILVTGRASVRFGGQTSCPPKRTDAKRRQSVKRPRSRSRRAQKGERFGRFAPRRDSRPEWSSIGNSSHRGRLPVRCRCGFAKGGRRRRCR